MNCALLNIIDDINSVNINYLYKFPKVSTYKQLLIDLPSIYKINYTKIQLTFIYQDVSNNYVVTNLDDYILKGDKINVKLTLAKSIYFLYDSYSKSIILKSYEISKLYEFYINKLYNTIDCEVFLYIKKRDKVKLIDVLDSPVHHKNKCINRLIKKYNY